MRSAMAWRGRNGFLTPFLDLPSNVGDRPVWVTMRPLRGDLPTSLSRREQPKLIGRKRRISLKNSTVDRALTA